MITLQYVKQIPRPYFPKAGKIYSAPSKRGELSILETFCCRGDTNATRRTNFRIRLLTGCDGLEQDASHFRYRTQGRSSGDPTCKLCGLGPENAEHFITNCHSLDAARNFALELAPPQVCPHLPNPARDPVGFSDVILGIDWIDHRPTQLFITEFLSQLKAARTAILQSRP